MEPLKIGITGVRGVVGQTLTPELVVRFAEAFGTYVDGGPVLVCRDPRPSGPMLQAAVTSGLLAVGCSVSDLGICPTPSLQLAVARDGAAGGVSITGGHNPPEWNALKFVRGDGLYLDAIQGEELLDLYHQGAVARVGWDRISTSVRTEDAIEPHLAALLAHTDVERLRRRRLRVAVDCGNGSCSRLVPRWLAALGCEVLPINDDTGLPFPRLPEPTVAAAAQARALVLAGRADLGLVLDADGERLSLVDEKGLALSEELTLPLAAEAALTRRVGPVVTNVSTSGVVDAVAARHGASVVRTPVGQAFISEAILAHAAVLGGEGNGAVAVPEVQPTHDSAAAIGLLLEHLAHSGEPLSALVAALPAAAVRKLALPVAPSLLFSALQDFRDRVGSVDGARVDHTDGVKLVWPDGWVHVRASNTQSLLRIISEAETQQRAQELADWARERVRL
ncbi:MAG TPA: phosphoglucosamine mutase [Ideonella sp.]|nr:phosphoglucosamine mutase [Ideonella sp.]